MTLRKKSLRLFKVKIVKVLATFTLALLAACSQSDQGQMPSAPDTSQFPQTEKDQAAAQRIVSENSSFTPIDDIVPPFIEICQHAADFNAAKVSLENAGWLSVEEDTHESLDAIVSDDIKTAPASGIELIAKTFRKKIDGTFAYIYFSQNSVEGGESYNTCTLFDFTVPYNEKLGVIEQSLTEWTSVEFSESAHIVDRLHGGVWYNVENVPGVKRVTAYVSKDSTSGRIVQGRRLTAHTIE